MVYITIIILNVSASEYKEERSYYQLEPKEYYYSPSELLEYIPSKSYGDGYYDHCESGYYEEQGYRL
ncbi:MAG TPA: hypothetical protein VFM28_02700 [Nitrososphaeraceae archaeon]|nr:hypothetical protein [Nitrososphaeraceae archaeon]